MWKEGWKSRNVRSFGIFVGVAMNSTHHLRYSPCSSSLRCCVLLDDAVVSVIWKGESRCQALDHQENLDLEAIAFCVMTAFCMYI